MKQIVYRFLLVFFLVGLLFSNLTAQKTTEEGVESDQVAESRLKAKTKAAKPVVKDDKRDKGKVDKKVEDLEKQVESMRAELAALKQLLLSRQKKAETPEPSSDAKVSAKAKGGTTAALGNEPAVKPRSKKDLSVDVGDFRITPYGIIFFNAFANNNGTNNADDPLWATANQSGNASASARQTRLGVRVTGGKIGGAKVTGVVEADFYGGFPGVGVGENMGVLRLRVAKAQLDWEKTSFIIGQDWMLFAPNSPKSLAAAAIPQFAAAGNPWSRLPQIRIEQKFGKNFKWQGAVLAPGTGDFPTGGATPALLQPGTGASSKVPFFQSRISYTNSNWFGAKKGGTIGFAGHYGRSRVTAGNIADDINSYGFAVDWSFPIVKRVTLAGEAFLGENLGGFQAGIFQGYNADSANRINNVLVADGIRGIRTRGGWAQLGWNIPALKDKLTIYGSAGVDDPRNEDLVTIGGRNFRVRNFGYAFDAIYQVTPNLSFGGEFRRLETSYFFTARQEANHINFGAAFKF